MIHQFNKAGLELVLDVGSGAIHVVDPMTADILKYLDKEEIINENISDSSKKALSQYDKNEVQNSLHELRQLVDDGLLYADDGYQEFMPQLGDAPIKAMCLHIAHDCNLRCKYCFASTGNFGGKRVLMPLEIAKKAIDLLIKKSGTRRNLEVDFFGGEPLMNLDVVKETVIYARSIEEQHHKHFRFTLTTNGLALDDDSIDFINKEMDNVVLSLDGRRHINDSMRLCMNGDSAYDRIVPLYQKLVQQRGDKEYYVRGTYTRQNLDFDKDVQHLYELGFDQLSVEPVVGEESDPYSIREQDIPAIQESYEVLMRDMISRNEAQANRYNFFHFMLDLDNGPCAIKRIKGCGCGNEYIAITPEGDIYPCHQFVGQSEFKMGHVDSDSIDSALKKQFSEAHLLNKAECQTCWAKFYCSGGCNANNYAFTKDINKPYTISCDLEKMRLECAIAIQARKMLNN